MVSVPRIQHNSAVFTADRAMTLVCLDDVHFDAPSQRSADDVLVVGRVSDLWAALFPEEQALLSTQNSRRTQAFSTARHCAHLAMAHHGHEPQPILRHEDGRSPRWPSGWQGSLTHSRDLAAACVTRARVSVGIDIEHFGRMTVPMAERVLTRRELSEAHTTRSLEDFATEVFSAKEAVYKAVYPIVQRFIGYQEVEIEYDSPRTFRAAYVGDHDPNQVMHVGCGELTRTQDAVLCKFQLEWT